MRISLIRVSVLKLLRSYIVARKSTKPSLRKVAKDYIKHRKPTRLDWIDQVSYIILFGVIVYIICN